MDKYEVRLMNQAMRDLDDIYAYIAGNLLEPGVAAEMVDALESEILSLEYLPYRCSERRTGSFANSGYRQLMVKNYIVIYRVDEANNLDTKNKYKFLREQYVWKFYLFYSQD